MIGGMTFYLPDYTRSIHHDGSERYVQFAHSSAARLGDQVSLRLRTAADAPVDRIVLRLCPDGEQQFIELKPDKATTNAPCRR